MNSQIPNQQPFFGRKISTVGTNVTQATDNQLVLKEDYNTGTTIYYDTSGIPNVILGKRPLSGLRGLYVSRSGIDVTLAADSQLLFNSDQDIFKIVFEGTTTIPTMNLSSQVVWQTITIPHGLNFIPIMDIYAQVNYLTWPNGVSAGSTTVPAYVPLPYNGNGVGNISYDYYIDAAITSTNIYITYYYSAGTTSGPIIFPETPIKYYLLQETSS